MATRRPTDTRRTADTPKEIPKVIKAQEAGATRAPAARTPAPRVTDPAPRNRGSISVDARRAMVAQSAYLRAERRGFAPGGEEQDWLAAEAEVDALLKARHGGPAQ